MNEQLIQLILYSNILSTTASNSHQHIVPVLNEAILAAQSNPDQSLVTLPMSDVFAYGDFPPPLGQKELLDVIVKTISQVLTLYTNTTIPVGTAGPLPVTAVLRNLTSA